MRGGYMVVVLALLLGGCVRDALVPCGELDCPAGDVCTASGCATTGEVEACTGKIDDDPCSGPTIAAGHCRDGVCRPSICGNGTQDFGERCDDGNEAPRDGCSAGCDSLEVCGDGLVDTPIGEQCDDGVVGQSADGCTSRCTVELQAWAQASPGLLQPRSNAAMTYDPDRRVVVMYGGQVSTGQFASDTWEWNGVSWRQRFPKTGPGGRSGHVMAYDAVHRRVVLHGGTTGSSQLSSTWTWDGTTWTDVTPAVGPEARFDAALTYTGGGTMMLFGGRDSAGIAKQETWQWDGASWMQLTQAQMPPPRSGHAMAYDPTCSCVILFGGLGATSSLLGDTWMWNAFGWQRLTTGGPVTPRSGHRMELDSRRQRIVLFGGLTPGGTRSNELFEWGGAAWSAVSQLNPPLPRERHSSAYDTLRQELVVFSGLEGSSLPLVTETFSWNGTAWVTRTTTLPPRRFVQSFATYDAARGQLVMFGGRSVVNSSDDTWLYDGAQWLATEPTRSPPGRNNHAMAYDSSRQRVMVVGGLTGLPSSDVWEWDGETWTDRTRTGEPAPSTRQNAGMAYDPMRKKLVYFGGFDSPTSTYFNETWEWADGTWTLLAPAHAPTPRNCSLVYDPSRQRVVLVGGNTPALVTDVWEWDGTDWHEVVSSTSVGELGAVVYHPLRGRLMLVGSKTWEWIGNDWVELPVTTIPTAAAYLRSIVFDAIQRRVVLVGREPSVPEEIAWELGFESPVSRPEICEAGIDSDGDGFAGCADPDCLGRCDPHCAIGVACSGPRPMCGDATCSSIEDHVLCPADCPAP